MLDAVPNLTTSQSGPLLPLEAHFLKRMAVIETWFQDQWSKTPAPLMSSVDLRHAGFKLAPVDTNLFPAGFNNLNPDFLPRCVQALQATLGNHGQRILLLPENHTRNQFYLHSLSILCQILLSAGYPLRLGNLNPEQSEAVLIELGNQPPLRLEPIIKQGSRISLKDFEPSLVILNNDLSAGIPDILENLEQSIEPNPALGWSTRLKSVHFGYYDQVINDFAPLIDLDPWLINPIFSEVADLDFMAKTGLDRLSSEVDAILLKLKERYQQMGRQDQPYVVIKADNGTYGMGIIVVHDASEVLNLNRKQRTKMAKIKGNQSVKRVMIQEGVYSVETMPNGSVAEPVVYMIGHYVVGGFYRVHSNLGSNDILNTPGMHFEPLAFEKVSNLSESTVPEGGHRFYAYAVIARLAALAAAREAAALSRGKV